MTAKKATLKSLQLEISIIKEELNDIKIELKEAKEELKEVQSVKEEKRNKKLEKNSETFDSNSKKDYDCRKCELICTTKSKLRAHIKTNHPKVIKWTWEASWKTQEKRIYMWSMQKRFSLRMET